MNRKTLNVTPYDPLDGYEHVVMIDKIREFSKVEKGLENATRIHFIDGEHVDVQESMKILQARIESAE